MVSARIFPARKEKVFRQKESMPPISVSRLGASASAGDMPQAAPARVNGKVWTGRIVVRLFIFLNANSLQAHSFSGKRAARARGVLTLPASAGTGDRQVFLQ
jgi:hypothetical protein